MSESEFALWRRAHSNGFPLGCSLFELESCECSPKQWPEPNSTALCDNIQLNANSSSRNKNSNKSAPATNDIEMCIQNLSRRFQFGLVVAIRVRSAADLINAPMRFANRPEPTGSNRTGAHRCALQSSQVTLSLYLSLELTLRSFMCVCVCILQAG